MDPNEELTEIPTGKLYKLKKHKNSDFSLFGITTAGDTKSHPSSKGICWRTTDGDDPVTVKSQDLWDTLTAS